MRILSILASPAPGGAEILVRNLCEAFTRRGHSCEILFMSEAANVGNPSDFEREFLAGLAPRGIRYRVMGRASFRNPLRAAREFRRAVREFGPDVLHAHLARGLMCRILAATPVPTIYTHHNVTANFPVLLFKLFDRFVDRYVAIGSACRGFLERHVRGPIVSIPNGVPASFAKGEKRTAAARDPFILSVGGLTAKKDYPTLIEAADAVLPRFAAQGRNARFAIAGEGPERARLEALIADKGLTGRFELLGARPDIPDLMRRADMLVNSSAHEGLPITLIEAAISGLPIVATDVGGNAEIVIDGENGFVVPPGRPDRLAERIHDLASDGVDYAAFSGRAIDIARRFTLESCADAHLALYEEVLPAARTEARFRTESA